MECKAGEWRSWEWRSWKWRGTASRRHHQRRRLSPTSPCLHAPVEVVVAVGDDEPEVGRATGTTRRGRQARLGVVSVVPGVDRLIWIVWRRVDERAVRVKRMHCSAYAANAVIHHLVQLVRAVVYGMVVNLGIMRIASRVPCVAVRHTGRRLSDAAPVHAILTAYMYHSAHLSATRFLLWAKSHTKRSVTTTGIVHPASITARQIPVHSL